MVASLVDSFAPTTGGGTGVQHWTESVTGGTIHVWVSIGSNGIPAGLSSNFTPTTAGLPPAQYTTSAVTTGSIAQGVVTGSQLNVWLQTGATPGNQLMRTAAQLFADIPNAYAGLSTVFRVLNTGAGTLTVAADAGATVTISGTNTVAQNTWREFILTLNSPTAATVQDIGGGTIV